MDRWMDERMDDLRFYVLVNTIFFISRQWPGDNERACAMEACLWLKKKTRLQQKSNPSLAGQSSRDSTPVKKLSCKIFQK